MIWMESCEDTQRFLTFVTVLIIVQSVNMSDGCYGNRDISTDELSNDDSYEKHMDYNIQFLLP